MLLGISGVIGSGKDTVGKMIQYLDAKSKEEKDRELAPKLFLPDFKYPSFEDWCKPKIHESGYDIGNSSMYEIHPNNWQIKKFAEKLKQIASMLTGIPRENFEDQEFKKTYLGKEWSYDKALSRDDMLQMNKYWETIDMTVREFLQRLGTEAIRENLHNNAWVNALFADYKGYAVDYREKGNDGLYPKETNFPNWIITDVRFPNEAKAVKERGGVIIRINRMKVATLEDKGILHPSETSLDDWEFDYVINNNGSINDLYDKVEDIFEEIHNKNYPN